MREQAEISQPQPQLLEVARPGCGPELGAAIALVSGLGREPRRLWKWRGEARARRGAGCWEFPCQQ